MKPARYLCRVCGKFVALKSDGTFRQHGQRAWTDTSCGGGCERVSCSNSGCKPEPEALRE